MAINGLAQRLRSADGLICDALCEQSNDRMESIIPHVQEHALLRPGHSHPLLASRDLATVLPVMCLHGKLSVIAVVTVKISSFSRYLFYHMIRKECRANMHE
jgi:hypothetical protein